MNTVKSWPFAIGFGLTAIIVAGYNLRLLSRSHEMPDGGLCMDCGLPVGFPFTMYRTEYMWGGEGFIASGVFANICVAIISSFLVGFIFSRLWQAIAIRTSAKSLR